MGGFSFCYNILGLNRVSIFLTILSKNICLSNLIFLLHIWINIRLWVLWYYVMIFIVLSIYPNINICSRRIKITVVNLANWTTLLIALRYLSICSSATCIYNVTLIKNIIIESKRFSFFSASALRNIFIYKWGICC